jgi:glycosyltransferase involved in cell wall biosynthesis
MPADRSTLPFISVITCSHDPRPEYLTRVLAALRAQTIDPERWEFLLIDSASRDPLGPRTDLSWHRHARAVREDEPGLTRARLRGIAEAKGDLLVFVDDDNVLDPDFLEQASKIFTERPDIGAWSGSTRPEFDQTPPDWTKRHWGNLVIRDVQRDMWSNLPMLPDTMPCGAGLCVRKEAASFYADLHRNGKRPFALDRNGTSLLSGGDNDLAACACDIGLGVGVFSALRLIHLIPAVRLREDYLVNLAENIALSTVVLRSFRAPPGSIGPLPLKTRIADVIRLAMMDARGRRVFRAARRGERRGMEQVAKMYRAGAS